MQEPTIRHSYVRLNNSFIHLAQYSGGESVLKARASPNGSLYDSYSVTKTSSSIGNNSHSGDTNSKLDSPTQRIIIFVPGNPGVIGVYHDFLASLFRIVNGSSRGDWNRTAILAISHNDFDHPDCVDYKADERILIEESELNFVERSITKNYRDEPHHVELQVLNKLIILKRLLNVDLEDCRLVFVGHSIGCYVILRLLQDRLMATAHAGSVFIHPALENLALTPRGSFYNTLFGYKIDVVVQSIALMLDCLLPKSAKLTLTRWFCSQEFVERSSDIVVESLAQLANPKSLAALVEMAKSEFAIVKNINADSMIKPHVSKLKLIYSIDDHWVNADNRRLLRNIYPDLQMEEQPTLHAFVMDPQTVMDYSVKIGLMIQDFVDSCQNNAKNH